MTFLTMLGVLLAGIILLIIGLFKKSKWLMIVSMVLLAVVLWQVILLLAI